MKNPLESLAKRFTKTASVEIKKEVKKTVLDLLPGILTFAGMVIGIIIFHDSVDSDESSLYPASSTTTITTNNYFFQDISDDTIASIIENMK